jgi:hypothetical protein
MDVLDPRFRLGLQAYPDQVRAAHDALCDSALTHLLNEQKTLLRGEELKAEEQGLCYAEMELYRQYSRLQEDMDIIATQERNMDRVFRSWFPSRAHLIPNQSSAPHSFEASPFPLSSLFDLFEQPQSHARLDLSSSDSDVSDASMGTSQDSASSPLSSTGKGFDEVNFEPLLQQEVEKLQSLIQQNISRITTTELHLTSALERLDVLRSTRESIAEDMDSLTKMEQSDKVARLALRRDCRMLTDRHEVLSSQMESLQARHHECNEKILILAEEKKRILSQMAAENSETQRLQDEIAALKTNLSELIAQTSEEKIKNSSELDAQLDAERTNRDNLRLQLQSLRKERVDLRRQSFYLENPKPSERVAPPRPPRPPRPPPPSVTRKIEDIRDILETLDTHANADSRHTLSPHMAPSSQAHIVLGSPSSHTIGEDARKASECANANFNNRNPDAILHFQSPQEARRREAESHSPSPSDKKRLHHHVSLLDLRNELLPPRRTNSTQMDKQIKSRSGTEGAGGTISASSSNAKKVSLAEFFRRKEEDPPRKDNADTWTSLDALVSPRGDGASGSGGGSEIRGMKKTQLFKHQDRKSMTKEKLGSTATKKKEKEKGTPRK